MNRDVFLSILALDSYNRGYGANLVLPANGSALGSATISQDSLVLGMNGNDRVDEDAGFYAIAYDVSQVPGFVSGGRVIAYRGTNMAPGTTLPDALNGWTLGAGFGSSTQGRMAVDFYRAVADTSDSIFDMGPQAITLTGHSLGGGLAGFVAALRQAPIAVGFDHMPFGVAAQAAVLSEAYKRALSDIVATEAEVFDAASSETFLDDIISETFTGSYFIDRVGWADFLRERMP